jgi:PAS domain S-box-containing protein
LKRLNILLADRVEERTAERDRLWNLSPDPFVVSDGNGVWLAASPAWTRLLGWSHDELLGRPADWMIHPDDLDAVHALRDRLARGEVAREFVNRLRGRDGAYRWLSWTSVPERDRIYNVARDVTAERERAEALRKAEEALRESQKMESIGQISGGLAHDFNNLLSPILGTLDLLQRSLPDERSARLVGGALEAAERARILVQRLLAFARRQPLQPSAVDVPGLIDNLKPLLASTVGPQVEIVVDVGSAVPPALVDANQLELAIINLAVNARDAMPDGGRLDIAVRTESADGESSLAAGDYVLISLADTGTGMPPSVLERAIEPFFSTKGSGRGTGLGLSMVHGLVAQLGGEMRIDSEVGRGTLVRLWLPVAHTAAPETSVAVSMPSSSTEHRGTALLVDDEPLVRESTAQMLTELGYRVIEAGSAREAIERLDEDDRIDVLVTDHFMPGMTGTELARQITRRRPGLPVLIVSGYADVDDLAPDLPRLSKPFRQYELGQALVAIEA